MGFIRDVRKILNSTPADTQVVMFSATISREVMDVAWEYQHDAVEITVAAEGDNRPMIAQFSLLSSGERRLEDMGRIIDDMRFKRVMVYSDNIRKRTGPPRRRRTDGRTVGRSVVVASTVRTYRTYRIRTVRTGPTDGRNVGTYGTVRYGR